MTRAYVGSRYAVLLAILSRAHAAWAQNAELAPPAAQPAPAANTAPGAPPDCFPPCREGYVCHLRQCISLCNPPCPSGQVCVGGARCALSAPGFSGTIREPPLPPLPPPVKEFGDQGFFMLGFHYGFSGNVEFDPNLGALGSTALVSTVGFNLRGDVPIERYLVLGPLFQFGAWRADATPAPSRSYYIDADLYIRGRIPIATRSANFQLWAGMPIGLTFDILSQDVAGVSGAGLGWNLGFLGGGAVHFTPKIGLFAEIGWLQHKVTHDAAPNIYVRLAQWNLNIGLVFRE